MADTSSRQARRARREALRAKSSKLPTRTEISTGRVSKQTKLVKQSLPVNKQNSNSVAATDSNLTESVKPKDLPFNPASATESKTKTPQGTGLDGCDHLNFKQTPCSATENSATNIAVIPNSKSQCLPPYDSEIEKDNGYSKGVASLAYSQTIPVSPVESIETQFHKSDMSDLDLEKYCSEFEAASQGHIMESDTSYIPLSPELSSLETMPFEKEISSSLDFDMEGSIGSNYATSGEFDVNRNVNSCIDMSISMGVDMNMSINRNTYENTNVDPHLEDVKIDDFISYTDESENPSDCDTIKYITQKRKVPLCVYQNRRDTSPISMTFNPNKRTLMAAWVTVAADSHHTSREAYMQSVLLAAASLKQRSMVTGLARQTMAPALGTSH